ncbi:MAG: primosomal protein N' [Clostridiales Family XIII bacterium]|jgi:primosomal protein N' (replication factor Y)|nr:primosomal protein N' [Clostridiales Family XIII bacterium]
MKYVDLIIDNDAERTDSLYTYGCAFDDVSVGMRVFAPFTAGNREKAAFVAAVKDEIGENIKGLKYVSRIDGEIALDANTIDICVWMRKRYFCRYIEAVHCFLPAGSPSKRGKSRRPEFDEIPDDIRVSLTDEQDAALKRILPRIDGGRYRTFLIHGVTGSGKTEVYLRAAERTLEKGKDVIVLVPEISLTPQTIGRFVARFGKERVAALHSKLSAGERYDEWRRIKDGAAQIVIGARSAVFAPVGDIGLIVVDEEHEGSYKSDMSPKYDTAEVAIKRAGQNGAVVILGSATPSLVSNYRAGRRLYERLRLKRRSTGTPLPNVSIVDMRDELKNGNKTIFSLELYRAMDESLAAGKQIILFLNRRGHSTFVSCRSCGYVMQCDDCGIALTYHRAEDEAQCHFCGKRREIPPLCPCCGGKYMRFFGAGTEKVEELARELFPYAATERLDLDTTRKKGSASGLLTRFRKGKTRILVGTQLVAKGLDFSNVGLVGIVSADVSLNIPDFRSAERSFQLITQAAGRAGRGDETGRVIIQSYKPEHYAICLAAENDYDAFYSAELSLRKAMEYPPFCDLVQITVSSRDETAATAGADEFAELLRAREGAASRKRVLGPNRARIYKSSELFRRLIYVKTPPSDREDIELFLSEKKRNFAMSKDSKKYSISIDVNPYNCT